MELSGAGSTVVKETKCGTGCWHLEECVVPPEIGSLRLMIRGQVDKNCSEVSRFHTIISVPYPAGK